MNKNKINQSGRSMVEMLGVMAIIGVLSVAGIAGYTTAMNKHRANEILNEASKRAVVVASQIASGRTPTLTEFTDNEVGGATFSQEVKDKDGNDWDMTDSQFRIGFEAGKEPSEAVLAQMKNIAGENGIVKDIIEGGLTYNNDLGTGDGTTPKGEEKLPSCDSCGAGVGLCVMYEEECVPKFYTTGPYEGTWLTVSADSNKCNHGGRWATMDDLAILGCHSVEGSECPVSFYGWTATKSGTDKAWGVDSDGHLGTHAIDEDHDIDFVYVAAICVR